jgi:metallophosphoesterase superfamily enzyme
MSPTAVEPVPGEPAAVADLGDESALVVADFHAGIEDALRYERGVELASDADARRERVLTLLDRTDPDRFVVLGDLGHRIGASRGDEREELTALIDAVTERVPFTLVKGNHDGGVADELGDRLDVRPGDGWVVGGSGTDGDDGTDEVSGSGGVAFVHGHTWPSEDALAASTICMGHEHPAVKLVDRVGGSRVESAWLRGPLRPEPFAENLGVDPADVHWGDPELVVFPAFNDRSGGPWVNVEGQEFLAPYLPEGFASAEAYLLDGTRLGDYRSV